MRASDAHNRGGAHAGRAFVPRTGARAIGILVAAGLIALDASAKPAVDSGLRAEGDPPTVNIRWKKTRLPAWVLSPGGRLSWSVDGPSTVRLTAYPACIASTPARLRVRLDGRSQPVWPVPLLAPPEDSPWNFDPPEAVGGRPGEPTRLELSISAGTHQLLVEAPREAVCLGAVGAERRPVELFDPDSIDGGPAPLAAATKPTAPAFDLDAIEPAPRAVGKTEKVPPAKPTAAAPLFDLDAIEPAPTARKVDPPRPSKPVAAAPAFDLDAIGETPATVERPKPVADKGTRTPPPSTRPAVASAPAFDLDAIATTRPSTPAFDLDSIGPVVAATKPSTTVVPTGPSTSTSTSISASGSPPVSTLPPPLPSVVALAEPSTEAMAAVPAAPPPPLEPGLEWGARAGTAVASSGRWEIGSLIEAGTAWRWRRQPRLQSTLQLGMQQAALVWDTVEAGRGPGRYGQVTRTWPLSVGLHYDPLGAASIQPWVGVSAGAGPQATYLERWGQAGTTIRGWSWQTAASAGVRMPLSWGTPALEVRWSRVDVPLVSALRPGAGAVVQQGWAALTVWAGWSRRW